MRFLTTSGPTRPRGLASLLSGLKISKRVARIVQRRGKAKASTPPSNAPQTSCVVHESTPFRKITPSKPEVGSQPQSTHRLPYEIVEIIITYVTSDLKTLKACSLTCRSWYTAAAAHIHHTFFLKERRPGIPCHEFEPLSKLYELGLMPLVRELRIRQWNRPWFLHQGLFPTNLRYFIAFSNVQTLRIHALDIDRFMPNIERYFGRLFPTVRSIALHWPTCTPRQLSFFLSLFSNLHDIEIWWDTEFPPDRPINKTLPPASFVPPTRKPRGRLEFREFQDFDGWKDLIASCRGLQFRYIELYKVGSYAPILSEACVDTLETFRFYLDWSPAEVPLSRFQTLRSLQVGGWLADARPAAVRDSIVMGAFSDITSPAFSELAIVLRRSEVAKIPSEIALFHTLRKMNEIKRFKLIFLLRILDWSQGEQRAFEEVLESVAAKGLLDFLESPHTIRAEGVTHYQWMPSAAYPK